MSKVPSDIFQPRVCGLLGLLRLSAVVKCRCVSGHCGEFRPQGRTPWTIDPSHFVPTRFDGRDAEQEAMRWGRHDSFIGCLPIDRRPSAPRVRLNSKDRDGSGPGRVVAAGLGEPFNYQ